MPDRHAERVASDTAFIREVFDAKEQVIARLGEDGINDVRDYEVVILAALGRRTDLQVMADLMSELWITGEAAADAADRLVAGGYLGMDAALSLCHQASTADSEDQGRRRGRAGKMPSPHDALLAWMGEKTAPEGSPGMMDMMEHLCDSWARRNEPALHRPRSHERGDITTRQASLHVTDRTVACPRGALDAGLRSRPFPDETASLLPGSLTTTRTGLPPASDDELYGPAINHSFDQPPIPTGRTGDCS